MSLQFILLFFLLCAHYIFILFLSLIFLDIRLNLYKYADVVNALHELEKRNPKVLNIPFEDDKLGKDVMIDEDIPYEVDKKSTKWIKWLKTVTLDQNKKAQI